MLTVNDLIKKYSVSKATIYNWIKRGMPYQKVGGKLTRFDEKEVDSWVLGSSVTDGETAN